MKVLVTGDRNWDDSDRIFTVIGALAALDKSQGKLEIINGDCPTGADALAIRAAKIFDADHEEYEAKWVIYGRGAGPIRNQLMIDDNPDIVLAVAFHDNIKEPRGTKDMLKRCLDHDIPAILYSKDKVFIVTEDLLS